GHMVKRTRRCCAIIGISVCLTLASVPATNAAQSIIPESRRIAWNAGIPGGIPAVQVAANVRDFGAKGDGATDDTAAIEKAIDSVWGAGAVLFPAGTYLITSTLKIAKSIVLRGEGADKTTLLFNVNGDAIQFITYKQGQWIKVDGGYTTGSTVLTLSNA